MRWVIDKKSSHTLTRAHSHSTGVSQSYQSILLRHHHPCSTSLHLLHISLSASYPLSPFFLRLNLENSFTFSLFTRMYMFLNIMSLLDTISSIFFLEDTCSHASHLLPLLHARPYPFGDCLMKQTVCLAIVYYCVAVLLLAPDMAHIFTTMLWPYLYKGKITLIRTAVIIVAAGNIISYNYTMRVFTVHSLQW